ncbi:MAG: OmpA family protein [Bacteroidota bacterium]|nr:OmpA family protein [Bacteroidota bacterium]
MIALDQTRGTRRRAQRMLVCLMLAGVAGLGHAQEGAVKTGSQEGTLVVNYYSTAPDPELEQLRGLAIDAIGVYLRGEMRVEDNDIGWSSSVRNVGKDMERIVRDLMRIRAFAGQEDFKGFSEEVAMLLVDFEELDMRDVERMRGSGTRSFEERTYVLIEQRVQEILLQCGVELGRYVNRGLLQKIGTVEQSLPVEELSRWTNPDENVPLEPIELNFNLETMSLLDREDESTWPEEGGDARAGGANVPEWQSMQDMMQRILSLVEAQEARIQALERGSPAPSVNPRDVAAQSWNPNRPLPASDPVLASLQLPASFDVQFYEGSARLTLTAQLQLNEVMEYLGMYPQLRVVCTGHADLTGDRAANLALSKKRAQAVQRHLLESGVLSTRVVLNYFGEERASNRGALDRRVEVAFFVND